MSADAIGSLGLETSEFDKATEHAISQLTSLGKEALVVTGNLAALALVVGGTLAKGIYDSRQRAKELNEELQAIKNSNPFGRAVDDVGMLEGKIKSLNAEIQKMDNEGVGERIFRFIGSAHLLGGSGFDASEAEQEARRAEAAKAIEDAMQRLGVREQKNLEVLKLQLAGRKEEAEILKNQLEWQDKIAKAADSGNGIKAVALKHEMQISEEMIRQKYALEEQERIRKEINEQAYKAQQDEIEFQKSIADENKRFDDEKLKQKADAAKAERKLDEELAEQKQKDLRKQIDDGNRLYLEDLERKKKQAIENRRIVDELVGESTVTDLRRRGNSTSARREETNQEYDRKIKEAIRNGNTEGEALLRRQQNAANADYDVEESNKTARERRMERTAGRQRESDEAKARRQNADLDNRLANGARGDKNSRLEQRREENMRNAQRANQQEALRGKGPDNRDPVALMKEGNELLKDIKSRLEPEK